VFTCGNIDTAPTFAARVLVYNLGQAPFKVAGGAPIATLVLESIVKSALLVLDCQGNHSDHNGQCESRQGTGGMVGQRTCQTRSRGPVESPSNVPRSQAGGEQFQGLQEDGPIDDVTAKRQ
jgi:hypothetical protein